jgi:uncharacterized protein (UPF0335 family)
LENDGAPLYTFLKRFNPQKIWDKSTAIFVACGCIAYNKLIQKVMEENMVEIAPKLPAGDNDNGDAKGEAKDVGGIGGQRLKAFIERIERLEEEKTALAEDLKEVYAEAKAVGFDTKTMRKVVRLRKMETDKRREEEELLELYKSAIGMA